MTTHTKSTMQIAYELWEARGRPHGSAEQDWIEAERLAADSHTESAPSSGKIEEALEESFPASDPPGRLTPDIPPSNADAKWAAAKSDRPPRARR